MKVKNNDKNINVDRVSKNGNEFRMCSNLSNHQLKIDCYTHSLVYMKHMVTTNPKSTRYIQETMRKESKHDTIE